LGGDFSNKTFLFKFQFLARRGKKNIQPCIQDSHRWHGMREYTSPPGTGVHCRPILRFSIASKKAIVCGMASEVIS